MNKKFLALSLALTLGASLDAIRWPWSSRVAPEDVMTMEAIPVKPRAEKKATSMSSSPLRRQAYIVDGSPQSRIREEDRMTSDSSARKKSETSYGKSRLSREVRMAPAKPVLRLGSFADDIGGMRGAFPASQRRSPAHGVSARSPRRHQ